MSEKPEKRFVSKGQYVRTMGSKTALYSLAGIALSGGLVVVTGIVSSLHSNHKPITLILALLAVAICTIIFVHSSLFFIQAKDIEQVRLVTRHTAHLLPPDETLVRVSNLPPSRQQAELLRAAQYSKETPAEELLRAAQENGQDV